MTDKTEDKLNLYQKLVEIRKVVPYLKKDTKSYKYSYVSGSSILSELVSKMNELQVLLVSSVVDYQISSEKKQTVSCKMLMTWINAENPEERLEVPFACFGSQDDISKAFGSALTYSERYFLLKFFNIATDDMDPDKSQGKQKAFNPKQSVEVDKKPENSREEDRKQILIDDITGGRKEVELQPRMQKYLEKMNVKSLSELTEQDLIPLHERIMSARKEMNGKEFKEQI